MLHSILMLVLLEDVLYTYMYHYAMGMKYKTIYNLPVITIAAQYFLSNNFQQLFN